MESEETSGIRDKVTGQLFTAVTDKVYATIQDREEFVAWAQDHDEELLETKERAALLNALVRERIDNGQELPPGVGFYPKPSISVRAS